MKDEKKTKNDLIRELRDLRQQARLLDTLRIRPDGVDAGLPLRHMLDAIHEGITLMDRDLTVVLTNSTVDRWYAHAMPLLGRKCYEAFLGRQEPCPECPAREALQSGKTQHYETQRLGPEGHDGWLEVWASPILDQDGRATAVLEYARDITKRKLAEQALTRSEENYRLLVENQADMVAKFDPQGQILFASPALGRALGRSEGQLVGSHYGPLVHPDDRPRAEAGFDALFNPPYLMHSQIRLLTPSGWRWQAWTHRAVLDAAGQVTEVVGSGRDIHEQKAAETALRESEARFRTIFDNAAAGIALAGLDGRLIQVNRKFLDMLGVEHEDIVGRMAQDFAFPEEVPASEENSRRALAALPATFRIEKRYRRKDGGEIWVDLSVSPILDSQGNITALMGVLLDISEAKQASLRLGQTLDEMDSVLENSLVGILVMRDRGITRLNTRLAEMLGYTAQELTGQSSRVLHISDKHFEEFAQVYYRRLDRTQFTNIEFPLRRKDGREIWCRIAGKAIDRSDLSRGVVWCVEDITEEKKAQQALRQYAKDLFRTKQQVEESARRLAAIIQELDEKNDRLEQEVAERVRVEEALRESERRYRELSIRDELSGLFNSRHFFELAETEIRRTTRYGHPLSLIFIDLDNFKKFNDAHGHLAGDKVLAALGKVLTSCTRDTDAAFRYGGEEFIILLPETAGPEAMAQGERVRAAFQKLTFTQKQVTQTLSVGVAQYKPGETLQQFIHRADLAMYQAKTSGKNRCLLAD